MDYRQMTAPCGIDCFNCEIHESNLTKEVAVVLNGKYGWPIEEIACKGCRQQDGKHIHLPQGCATLDCVKAKGVQFCSDCDDFPCSFLAPVADLAATVGIELVPIDGPQANKLLQQYSFFGADEIPDDAYKGVSGVKTVSVHALWVTSSKQPDDLIYKITAALWNPNSRKLLDSGHAKGRVIRLETATVGLGIPLHAGAEKFYKEKGLLR